MPGVAALTAAALRSPLSARERGSVFAALAQGDTQSLAGARVQVSAAAPLAVDDILAEVSDLEEGEASPEELAGLAALFQSGYSSSSEEAPPPPPTRRRKQGKSKRRQ